MASERIDPRDYPGEPISLDHYARYAYAAQFATGRRVLDAACGLGYGSDYLRAAGAETVVGVDVSSDAIQSARDRFAPERLTFVVADIHTLSDTLAGPWDLIASFETIEHLASPRQFIAECGAALAAGGVVVASVPNAVRDPEGVNEFHVQRFTRSSFEELLRTTFNFVEIRPQYFCLGSLIDIGDDAQVADLRTSGALRASALDGATEPECFIAVCAHDRHPTVRQSVFGHARTFWEHHQGVLQGVTWLEEKLTDSQRREAECAAEVKRQQAEFAAVREAEGWLEGERARWQATAADLMTQLERHQAAFAELEDAKRWLEEERARWQNTAAQLHAQLEQQQSAFKELDAAKRWLEQERAKWEQQARNASN